MIVRTAVITNLIVETMLRLSCDDDRSAWAVKISPGGQLLKLVVEQWQALAMRSLPERAGPRK